MDVFFFVCFFLSLQLCHVFPGLVVGIIIWAVGVISAGDWCSRIALVVAYDWLGYWREFAKWRSTFQWLSHVGFVCVCLLVSSVEFAKLKINFCDVFLGLLRSVTSYLDWGIIWAVLPVSVVSTLGLLRWNMEFHPAFISDVLRSFTADRTDIFRFVFWD